MSHVSEYVASVQGRVSAYKRMPLHQATVYAVESVVHAVTPPAVIGSSGAQAFIDDLCDDMEIDSPEVIVNEIKGGFVACASKDHYAIILSTNNTDVLTLCHELAHLLCPKGEGHNEEWRTTFVRLARRYVSVEHGALLHTLYNRCDLPTAWS